MASSNYQFYLNICLETLCMSLIGYLSGELSDAISVQSSRAGYFHCQFYLCGRPQPDDSSLPVQISPSGNSYHLVRQYTIKIFMIKIESLNCNFCRKWRSAAQFFFGQV